MNLPDIIGLLGALDAQALVNAVFHHVSPQLAKPAFLLAINRANTETKQKLGRICKLAGEKLDRPDPDEEGAAGDLARAMGEIKLF